VVAAAQAADHPDSGRALEDLCRSYWPPLYGYVRRRGYSPQDAEDLTQSFFALVLRKDVLRSADQEKGRMRTYLLTALQRFLVNDYHRKMAQKRGGDRVHVSFDTGILETRIAHEKGDASASSFDHQWALNLLGQVMHALTEEYGQAGKMREFTCLKACLTTEGGAFDYRRAAGELGLQEGTVRVAVHRLRKRFRSLFRDAVSRTVCDPADVRDEMRYVVKVLGAVE